MSLEIRGWSAQREKAFLDWCDFCRQKIMNSRNIAQNLTNNQPTNTYEEQIMRLVKPGRSITIMELLGQLPQNLLVNLNTKNVILKLATMGNLKIGSSLDSRTETDRDFYVEFNKIQHTSKVVATLPKNTPKSTAAKVLDGEYNYEGPKHNFNEYTPPKINVKPKSTFLDIEPIKTKSVKASSSVINRFQKQMNNLKPLNSQKRPTISNQDLSKPVPPKLQINKIEEPIIKKESTNKIVLTPKAENKIIITSKITPVVSTPPINNEIKKEIINFNNNLSLINKYYILAFIKDSYKKEKKKLKIIKYKNVLEKEADSQWEKERASFGFAKPNGIKMFIYYLSKLLVIGLFIQNPKKKNPLKKSANEIWKQLKRSSGSYDNAKSSVLKKYDILKDLFE